MLSITGPPRTMVLVLYADINAANSGDSTESRAELLVNANVNAANSDDTLDPGSGSLVDVGSNSNGTDKSIYGC